MTYPDVDPQPDFPALEQRVLELLGSGAHVRRVGRATPGGRARAPTSTSSTTGRPFANGLPHYGHLLTGYVKDVVPRYQTMRGQRVERRFGWDCHGLPVEMEAEKELGVVGHARHRRSTASTRFNEACRTSVLRYTERVGALRHPPGPLGRLRQRLQDAWTSPTWRASCGRSSSCGTRACIYEGYRVLPYCWRCETPLSNFEIRHGRRLPRPPGPGRHRARSSSTRPRRPGPDAVAGLDDHAVDAAVEPRPRRRARHRLRRVRATTATRYVLAESRAAAYAAAARRAPSGGHRDRAPSSSGARYTPLFPYFADDPERLPRARRRLRHHRGRHRRRPHRARLRRGRPARGRGRRHRRWSCPVDDRRPLHRRGARRTRACTSSTPTADHPRPQGAGHASSATTPTTTPTRTAGAPTRRSSTGPCRRWFVQVTAFQRPHARAQPARSHWVPEHVRDGSFGKWLEGARDWSISRNRFWGSPIPVWKSDDPGLPAHRRLRQPRRARARLRRPARPTCTGPASTS